MKNIKNIKISLAFMLTVSNTAAFAFGVSTPAPSIDEMVAQRDKNVAALKEHDLKQFMEKGGYEQYLQYGGERIPEMENYIKSNPNYKATYNAEYDLSLLPNYEYLKENGYMNGGSGTTGGTVAGSTGTTGGTVAGNTGTTGGTVAGSAGTTGGTSSGSAYKRGIGDTAPLMIPEYTIEQLQQANCDPEIWSKLVLNYLEKRGSERQVQGQMQVIDQMLAAPNAEDSDSNGNAISSCWDRAIGQFSQIADTLDNILAIFSGDFDFGELAQKALTQITNYACNQLVNYTGQVARGINGQIVGAYKDSVDAVIGFGIKNPDIGLNVDLGDGYDKGKNQHEIRDIFGNIRSTSTNTINNATKDYEFDIKQIYKEAEAAFQ